MKGRKRLIALAMCICMACTVISPEIMSKAEETSEGQLRTFNGWRDTVCYQDDFSTGDKYQSAFGDFIPNGKAMTWNCAGGYLEYPSNQDVGLAFFNGLNITQNYAVSMDVTPASTSSYVALVAYGSVSGATTTGYEFGIVSGTTFRLGYRPSSGSYETIVTKNITDAELGITDNAAGKQITMYMSIVTNAAGNLEIKCYAAYEGTEVLVFEATTDETNTYSTSGKPGFRTQCSGTKIDNVSIIRKEPAIDSVDLYQDDFADLAKYKNALGSYVDNEWAVMKWDSQNQNLYYPSDLIEDNAVALFKGMPNAATQQNYTIEAKVKKGQPDGWVALVAYGSENDSGKTNGYEFALVKSGTGTIFRLGYRKDEGFNQLTDVNEKKCEIDVTNVQELGISGNLVGEDILMRMSVITNDAGNVELKCYAVYNDVEQLIFECQAEGATTGITYGAPGIRMTCRNTVIDDIRITQEESSPIIYEDSFNSWDGYIEALGETPTAEKQFMWENSMLKANTSVAYGSLFKNVKVQTNYTIAADVSLETTDSGRFGGVIAYGTGTKGDNTTGYEFAINNGNFRLYKRGTGAGVCGSEVSISGNSMNATQPIRLSLSAITNYDKETNEAVSVTLICKAAQNNVEKTIFEYTDTSNLHVSGVPGLKCNPKNGQCTIDNLTITQIPDNYMGIKAYRSDETYTAPMKEGYVFAGWYTDEELTTPLATDVEFGGAYAKWVDKEVLKAICQLPVNPNKSDDTTNLRIMTSVDNGQYQKVGFTVSVGTVRDFDFTDTKEVYQKVTAIEDKVGAFEHSAMSAFENEDSKYFMAHTLLGIPQSVFGDIITVTPMWTTLDGTTVTGQIKTFTINNIIDELSNSNQ